MTPPTIAKQKMDMMTQSSRMGVASTPKYSAMPPQTPATFLSVFERVSRRGARRLRHNHPRGQVGQHTTDDGAWHDRQDDPGGANDDHVDFEVLRQTGAHAGNLSICPRTRQSSNDHMYTSQSVIRPPPACGSRGPRNIRVFIPLPESNRRATPSNGADL